MRKNCNLEKSQVNSNIQISEPGTIAPAYLDLSPEEFSRLIKQARTLLSPCRVCPRECGVDRLGGEEGFCETGALAEVSSYNEHRGEEPPISGSRGSGTIFFAHCNLRCVFCQNYPISHLGHGSPVSTEELAEMMLSLQRRGCHNLNLVTPTHVTPQILEALKLAIAGGLKIPLVWNSGGYDSVETLRLLDGIVDIYLPDMKYDDDANAAKYSDVPNGRGDRPVAPTRGYREVNHAAIREMHRQVGDLICDEDDIAVRGLIVRHLVLPGGLAGSEGVLRFLAEEVSLNTAISLMAQFFRPIGRASSQSWPRD
jgi:putative pyruvate formate lyase activating enzyme